MASARMSSKHGVHPDGDTRVREHLSHLGMRRRCRKNGQVAWGGQGPREDGGGWALNHEGPSVPSVDDTHAVCELRKLLGGENRSRISDAEKMSST